MRQVFIGANDNITDRLSFERKLYVIRKQAENWGTREEKQFYFVSLSSQTIVYKGLLTSDQVDAFILIYRMKHLFLHFHLFIQDLVQIHFRHGKEPIQTVT